MPSVFDTPNIVDLKDLLKELTSKVSDCDEEKANLKVLEKLKQEKEENDKAKEEGSDQ